MFECLKVNRLDPFVSNCQNSVSYFIDFREKEKNAALGSALDGVSDPVVAETAAPRSRRQSRASSFSLGRSARVNSLRFAAERVLRD